MHLAIFSNVSMPYFSVPAEDSFKKHLVVSNTDFVLKPPKALMPHVISVPGIFVEDPQPLKDVALKGFLDSATEGAIVSISTECDYTSVLWRSHHHHHHHHHHTLAPF